jgi:hypothetical protein
MLERDLEERFKREVERRGALALKFTSPGMRGVMDRVVMLPNERVVWVELKQPGKKLRPLQKWCAGLFRRHGHRVYLVDSHQALDKFLAEVFGDEV